jgi:hypothetical protein
VRTQLLFYMNEVTPTESKDSHTRPPYRQAIPTGLAAGALVTRSSRQVRLSTSS